MSTHTSCDCARVASLSWSNPSVVSARLHLLLEAIALYPTLDVEVDFLRDPVLFNTTTTTFRERRAILRGFLGAVRGALRTGQRLGLRVPPKARR